MLRTAVQAWRNSRTTPCQSRAQLLLQATAVRNCYPASFAGCSRLFGSKTLRDPERPKQPLLPFFRFLADYRTKNPVGSTEAIPTYKDQTAAAGKAWHALTAEERHPFVTAFEADKVLHDEKMAEYRASGKEDYFRRDPARPIQPMSGFLRFSQQFRALNAHLTSKDGLSMADIAKEAGIAWKQTLTDAEREQWNLQYEQEKTVYESALKEYLESGKEKEWLEKTGRPLEKEPTEKQKEAAKQKELKQKAKEMKRKEAEKKERERIKAREVLKNEREKKRRATEREREKKRREREILSARKKKEQLKALREKSEAKKSEGEASKSADAADSGPKEEVPAAEGETQKA